MRSLSSRSGRALDPTDADLPRVQFAASWKSSFGLVSPTAVTAAPSIDPRARRRPGGEHRDDRPARGRCVRLHEAHLLRHPVFRRPPQADRDQRQTHEPPADLSLHAAARCDQGVGRLVPGEPGNRPAVGVSWASGSPAGGPLNATDDTATSVTTTAHNREPAEESRRPPPCSMSPSQAAVPGPPADCKTPSIDTFLEPPAASTLDASVKSSVTPPRPTVELGVQGPCHQRPAEGQKVASLANVVQNRPEFRKKTSSGCRFEAAEPERSGVRVTKMGAVSPFW